ncbi:nuclear pore complex protein Nup85 [Phymastichus coffea]|uniref:nuclear pore complex protein Nup85 n=1 Tax=Phymastichus coffea TaxID=108790 RepID=UPI00273B8813|nr:nuclear pore complex protein Nup85 [Phymastichus coffea]XP_058805402.1 nuclear pore complex protein Nup85 [Phymastichus coffea]
MADRNTAKIIAIPDDICQKAGTAATWIGPNKLAVFGYKHVNINSKGTQSNFAPCEAKVHFLRPEVILFSPSLRKLVNESNGVFLSVQKIRCSPTANDSRPEMLKYSKQYRSILRACVEELQDLAEKSTPEKKTMYENFQTIFYNVECVWHLTEILYVDVIPGDVVLPQLLDWVRFHFPSREIMAMKILARKKIGADLEGMEYWEAVIGCALHGKLDIARALLALHSKADHNAFIAAENALRNMPVYNVYGGYSVKEFTIRWKQWQMSLSQSIDSKIFAIEPNLESLMKLIVGNEIWEFTKYTDAWYELLAAKLFYSAPCCKQPELARHANSIAVKWQSNKKSTLLTLDNIILALMESDLHQVIKEIQYMNDNGWFAAHLTDLLFHCGRLNIMDKHQVNVTDLLHESLILDYGSTLMSHHSLWQCGASYLVHCSDQGMSRLECLLETLPLGNEVRVLKIINVAKENHLNKLASSICKIQGIKCIKQGRLGNALAWALKAPDSYFASYIADCFLKHYVDHADIQCRDLLENLGSCMLTSDRLTFLGKYCEFHQMYGIGEFKEAARLLISLVVSNLTPKYFWPILLTDAIPLLETDDLVFTSEDTYELLAAVEKHGEDPKFEDKVDIFRLAAARNLARALIIEGSQPD